MAIVKFDAQGIPLPGVIPFPGHEHIFLYAPHAREEPDLLVCDNCGAEKVYNPNNAATAEVLQVKWREAHKSCVRNNRNRGDK